MENFLTIFKNNWLGFLLVFVLSTFLPLTTIIYYNIRRDRRRIEIQETLDSLNFTFNSQKEGDIYDLYNDPFSFILAVFYLFIITLIGLGILFVAPGLGFEDFPVTKIGNWEFPQPGSRVITGLAFLGAYVWGVQYVMRRYSLNDLIPAVYFNLNIRTILASLIALVLYNGTQVFVSETDTNSDFVFKIWPALAFLIGFYPEEGLRWLTKKLPIFSETNLLTRKAPLNIIEGVGNYDVMRLRELGIDSCYDLAVVDFIPLLLKTPYTTRQLADWILQAKLCSYFGSSAEELRKVGIRTIKDVMDLEEEEMDELAKETSLNVNILKRTKNEVTGKKDIEYLHRILRTTGAFPQPGAEYTGMLPEAVLEKPKNIQPSRNLVD